jgi:hypothetical protein
MMQQVTTALLRLQRQVVGGAKGYVAKFKITFRATICNFRITFYKKKNMLYKGTVLLAMEKREEWLLLYSEPRADSMESTQATAHNAVLKPLGDVN